MAELDSGSGTGGGSDPPDDDGGIISNIIGGIAAIFEQEADPVEMTQQEQTTAALNLAGLSEEQNRVLSEFVSTPVGFILGVILQELLGGIEAVTTAFVKAISVVFFGDGPGLQGDALGITDIPLLLGDLVVGIVQPTGNGGTIGDAVISLAEIPIGIVVDLAGQAGPLEPVILASGAAASIIGFAWVSRQVLVIAADAIPGAEVLLP